MPIGRGFLKSLSHPRHHLDAWEWIEDHTESYPDGLRVQPWRQPAKAQAPKALATAQLLKPRDLGELDQPGHYLEVFDGEQEHLILLPPGDGAAAALDANLFTNHYRGKQIIIPDAVESFYKLFLELYGKGLLALGYRIYLIGSLSRILAMRVVKDRHVWWLTDAATVTGCDVNALLAALENEQSVGCTLDTGTTRLYRVLDTIQHELVRRFGTRLYPTVGMTAVRAASAYLPPEALMWRPSPSIIAMCRAGGGFRGGYVYSETWDGEASEIDVRRMYTAALREQLPWCIAFSVWHPDRGGTPGMWMCTVQGPGKVGIRIARWKGPSDGFVHEKWNGKEAVCILPSAEIPGLLALGFTVLPAYGYEYTKTFDLGEYVNRLELLTEIHGADSIMGQLCKALGNQVWGKWAQSPEAVDLCFAAEPPSEEWSPFLDGMDEIPNLYTRAVTTYKGHQQIAMAATVTAIGRSQLYGMLAWLIDHGHKPRSWLTDAVIIEGQPPPDIPWEQTSFGAWRTVWHREHVWLLRAAGYMWDGGMKWSGHDAPSVGGFLELYKEKAGPGELPPSPAVLQTRKWGKTG